MVNNILLIMSLTICHFENSSCPLTAFNTTIINAALFDRNIQEILIFCEMTRNLDQGLSSWSSGASMTVAVYKMQEVGEHDQNMFRIQSDWVLDGSILCDFLGQIFCGTFPHPIFSPLCYTLAKPGRAWRAMNPPPPFPVIGLGGIIYESLFTDWVCSIYKAS